MWLRSFMQSCVISTWTEEKISVPGILSLSLLFLATITPKVEMNLLNLDFIKIEISISYLSNARLFFHFIIFFY